MKISKAFLEALNIMKKFYKLELPLAAVLKAKPAQYYQT